MSYKLFLDDDRVPKDCVTYMHQRIGARNPIYLEEGWIVVRDYIQFCATLGHKGIPAFVSFDHDLGACVEDYEEMNGILVMKEGTPATKWEKTGYDCAKALVEECIERKCPLPEYAVHSANPVGTENILTFLRNAEKELKKTNYDKT